MPRMAESVENRMRISRMVYRRRRIISSSPSCQTWAGTDIMNKIFFSKELYNSLDTWYQAVIDVIQMTSDNVSIVDEHKDCQGVGSK